MAEFDDITAEDAQTAARMQADVGAEHLAGIYATALLGATENAGLTSEVLAELETLVTDVLDAHPAFEAILASALISHDEKVGILDRVFGRAAFAADAEFSEGRLAARPAGLPAGDPPGRSRWKIISAGGSASRSSRPLRSTMRWPRHRRAAPQRAGRRAADQPHGRPDVIGGIVVRVGDTVYDGSVANQLEDIRQQMIDRSVHEIQSRRNRFSHPAGN